MPLSAILEDYQRSVLQLKQSPYLTWPAHVHLLHVKQAASSIGDTTKQHVLDIYNAPAYRALREKLVTRKDAGPCNKCSFL